MENSRTFAGMIKKILFVLLCFICVGAVSPIFANETMEPEKTDSVKPLPKGIFRPAHWVWRYLKNTNKQSYKKIDCSFVGGPSYNTTNSLGIGGGISALYSWDRSDLSLQKSNFSVFFNASITGMLQFLMQGNNFMPGDAQRWNYKIRARRMSRDFWGVGYKNGDLDDQETSYKMFMVSFQPDYLFRLRQHLYLGPQIYLEYSNAYTMDKPELLDGHSREIFALGAGGVLQYDSRDFALNAYRGNYFRLEQMFYPGFINDHPFMRTEVSYSAYRQVWKGGVLAMDLHGMFNYGDDVPWTMMAMAGTGGRMRGYYEGRYRDRNIMEGQVELRQRVANRLGIAVWGGAANVFKDFQNISYHQILPTYGAGLRWEFKKRVNIRFDFGFTKDKPGLDVGINEAF